MKLSEIIYQNDKLCHFSTELSTKVCLAAANPLHLGGRRVDTAVKP